MHVAIIMDGNGRWAMRRGLPRVAGHRAGIAAVKRVVERALDWEIARLTLYAFSSDNWVVRLPKCKAFSGCCVPTCAWKLSDSVNVESGSRPSDAAIDWLNPY